jgi:hypothetical protein
MAENTAKAMKNKIAHNSGFSSCENLRFLIQLSKVIKNNITIEASVPAMLNVLKMNKR